MTTLFAEELARLLDRSGVARQEMAKRIGIHKQMLWLLQTGKRLPTPAMIERVSDALNLSPPLRIKLHRCAARDRGYHV